jgi:ketosteroid isomerase-like protein
MLKRFLAVENWLKTPADRDIITRWTRDGQGDVPLALRHRLRLPPLPPEEASEWEFLALGDTGDADAAGPNDSPQDAVARQLTRDAAAPVGTGRGRFVVHTGDVIYMTGERRLYERNFRRPYAAFLTADSTVENLVFRLPFLPVPGNHDYYDLGTWAKWLAKVPLLGSGLRAVAHELFAFGLPEGGSEMGRAYMDAFVARDDTDLASYEPGARTRLPNRYYQFTHGGVDFFALDSNTLDAPPPWADAAEVHRVARHRRQELEAKARVLDESLRREQKVREDRRAAERQALAADPTRAVTIRQFAAALGERMDALVAALHGSTAVGTDAAWAEARSAVELADRRWKEGVTDLDAALSAADPDAATVALDRLDEASDDACRALLMVEGHLGTLPAASPERQTLTAASDAVEQGQSAYAAAVEPWAKELDARIHALSEESLDVQRDLALARRRERYRPEDHDGAQLEWLDAALTEAERERPGNWRIVYLHHPLYTTIGNHCERPDVIGLRDNIISFLQKPGRVHLVLSGHSHAFEWFRSNALPNAGLFVSGGGGQISLRPSILEPKRLAKSRDRYDALRAAGVQEWASGGTGPIASDGEDGPVYHHLRFVVRPDVIEVHPIGSRWLKPSGQFRREEPMPVYHAAELRADSPRLKARTLECVEVRRDRPPIARWVG